MEGEATARHLAKEAEMELAAEIAQKLYIEGEKLAERHHQEIEYLAAQQNVETQRLSPEAQERVKQMLRAQTAMAQGPGAIPKQPVKADTAILGADGGQQGEDAAKPIFKKLDE